MKSANRERRNCLDTAQLTVLTGGHEIGCQIGKALLIIEGSDNAALHAGRLIENILDLFGLDSLAKNHDLTVFAAKEGYVSVGQSIAEIAICRRTAVFPHRRGVGLNRGPTGEPAVDCFYIHLE